MPSHQRLIPSPFVTSRSHPLVERRPRQAFGESVRNAVEIGDVVALPDVHVDVVVLPKDAHAVRTATRHLQPREEDRMDGPNDVDRHYGGFV